MFRALQAERVTAAEGQLYAFMEESEKREETLRKYARRLESDLAEAKKAMALAEQQTQQVVELEDKVEELESVVRESAKQCEDLRNAQRETTTRFEDQTKKLKTMSHDMEVYGLMSGLEVSNVTDTGFFGVVANPETNVRVAFRIERLDEPEESTETKSNGDKDQENVDDDSHVNGDGDGDGAGNPNKDADVKADNDNRSNSNSNSKTKDSGMMRFEPILNGKVLPSFLQSPIEFETSQCPALLQNVLKAVFSD